MILNGNEQLQRKVARMSVFVSFETLFQSVGGYRTRKYIYRTLVASAIGAMVTGGVFLLMNSPG